MVLVRAHSRLARSNLRGLMNHIKPLISIGGFIILCAALFFGLGIQIPHHVARVTGISAADGGRSPLIGIYSSPNAASSTLTLLRITDGVAQTFPGQWQANFVSPQVVAVFGETETQKNEQRLYVLDGVSGKQFAISQLPGRITQVGMNPLGTYALVTGIRADKKNDYYSCVADITAPGFPCADVLTGILHAPTSTSPHILAFWNKQMPRELLIADQTTRHYFSFDPWDDAPKSVSSDYVTAAVKQLVATPNAFHYARFGPFIRAENLATHVKKTFLVWPWTEVRPVSENALMLRTRGVYELLNVTNNTRAVFTTQDPQTHFVGYFKAL